MKTLSGLSHLFITIFLHNFSAVMVIPAITDVTMSALCPGRDECSLAIYLTGFQQAVCSVTPYFGFLPAFHMHSSFLCSSRSPCMILFFVTYATGLSDPGLLENNILFVCPSITCRHNQYFVQVKTLKLWLRCQAYIILLESKIQYHEATVEYRPLTGRGLSVLCPPNPIGNFLSVSADKHFGCNCYNMWRNCQPLLAPHFFTLFVNLG